MKNKAAIPACAAALLAATFLGGCATPPPMPVSHYYSTFDHKGVSPDERTRRHGPYHLVLSGATHAHLDGHSIFHAPRRNDAEWRRESRNIHELRRNLEEMGEKYITRPNEPDALDLLLAIQLMWFMQHDTKNFALRPGDGGLGSAFRCELYGGQNADDLIPWNSFLGMQKHALKTHAALFPATGKGKRLNIWVTYLEVKSAGENPDMPFPHYLWGFYVFGGEEPPWPKLVFMTFPGCPGEKASWGEQTLCPINLDPQTGKATLDLPKGPVPLHGAPEVFPNGVLWTYDPGAYRNLFGDRFAAAAIHLLNGMTDEQLDALEDEEW